MQNSEFDKLPVFLREQYINLENHCLAFQSAHTDLLIIAVDDFGTQIQLRNLDEENPYTYTINNPRLDSGKPYARISYRPQSNQSNELFENPKVLMVSIPENLSQWFELVKRHDELINIRAKRTNQILKQYEVEYDEYYKLEDEEDSLNAFTEQQQLILYTNIQRLLDDFKTINNPTDEELEVIRQGEELKKEIPKLNKKATLNKLSKFLAKARHEGMLIGKGLFDEVKKEVFKALIECGKSLIESGIHEINVHHLLH